MEHLESPVGTEHSHSTANVPAAPHLHHLLAAERVCFLGNLSTAHCKCCAMPTTLCAALSLCCSVPQSSVLQSSASCCWHSPLGFFFCILSPRALTHTSSMVMHTKISKSFCLDFERQLSVLHPSFVCAGLSAVLQHIHSECNRGRREELTEATMGRSPGSALPL